MSQGTPFRDCFRKFILLSPTWKNLCKLNNFDFILSDHITSEICCFLQETRNDILLSPPMSECGFSGNLQVNLFSVMKLHALLLVQISFWHSICKEVGSRWCRLRILGQAGVKRGARYYFLHSTYLDYSCKLLSFLVGNTKQHPAFTTYLRIWFQWLSSGKLKLCELLQVNGSLKNSICKKSLIRRVKLKNLTQYIILLNISRLLLLIGFD